MSSNTVAEHSRILVIMKNSSINSRETGIIPASRQKKSKSPNITKRSLIKLIIKSKDQQKQVG